uniref:Uncharacterized protein n=1 Tax=Arundo donax TaxID=35708 RepID=A0A0A9AL97_ARUDO
MPGRRHSHRRRRPKSPSREGEAAGMEEPAPVLDRQHNVQIIRSPAMCKGFRHVVKTNARTISSIIPGRGLMYLSFNRQAGGTLA